MLDKIKLHAVENVSKSIMCNGDLAKSITDIRVILIGSLEKASVMEKQKLWF